MGKEYLVQPALYAERLADYKKGESINNKWKPISQKVAYKESTNGFCGNIAMNLGVNSKTKKIKFFTNLDFGKGYAHLYETISAALLLYRLICLIKQPIVTSEGAEGYKVPWVIFLKHFETGEILGISEWKGAVTLKSRFHSVKELPESYKKDMTELLNLVFSNKSPHPYDDTTAGSVA